MITMDQFLQRFCKRARIAPITSKEELTTYIRKEFFVLCRKGIIGGTYLKRYKSQFERVGVLYNKTNYEAKYLQDNKNLCIFIESDVIRAIGENSLVYCVNSFVAIKDNAIAVCKNSSAYCYHSSKINADWCSYIHVFDNVEAIIENCSNVVAEDNSKIEIEHCMAFALDNVTIEARDTCYIQAQDGVKIMAENNSCIIAKDNVKIEADETCIIKRV